VSAVADALGVAPDAAPAQVQAALRQLSRRALTELDRALGVRVESFREFIARTDPGYIFADHLEELIQACQDIADGELSRLIVEIPVRHGKSKTITQLFPAYFLSRYGWLTVAVASYGDTLSLDHARKAKAAFEAQGGRLAGDAKSVRHWYTVDGGSMWATSINGGGTGKPLDLGIIDDPLKNKADSRSATIKRAVTDFYDAVFSTRQNTADAALIVTAARWANDDLIGTLLSREGDEDTEPEGWRVIHLPAIAQGTPPAYPKTVTVVPDRRAPGEPLWPERWPLARLLRWQKKKPEDFSALFQQRPTSREGTFFKWDWFKRVPQPHAVAFRVRYWDTAGTEGAGDFTAGVLVAYRPGAPIEYLIEDVVRGQWAPARRNYHIVETAKRDAAKFGRHGFAVWIEKEAGVGGADRTADITRGLAGFRVFTEPATGDKGLRAEPLAGQAQNGNVGIVDAPWNEAFLEELCAFEPHMTGGHDDQVDGASGGFNRVTDVPGTAWGEEDFAVV
jgi:predicted phage terminase large subunit-like protein